MTITTTCPFCGKIQFIRVHNEDFHDWENGVPAQEAFPYLSEDDREALISGICPNCWDEMIGGKGEEDEPDLEWGYDEDMGFDPYLGCYTDDC